MPKKRLLNSKSAVMAQASPMLRPESSHLTNTTIKASRPSSNVSGRPKRISAEKENFLREREKLLTVMARRKEAERLRKIKEAQELVELRKRID